MDSPSQRYVHIDQQNPQVSRANNVLINVCGVLKWSTRKRSQLISECKTLSTMISRRISDDPSDDSVSPSESMSDDQHQQDSKNPLSLKPSFNIRFDWCDENLDVLNVYDLVLPWNMHTDPSILTRPPPDASNLENVPSSSKLARSAAKKRPQVQFSLIPRKRVCFPISYYNPWPEQTHKLPFPGKRYYKIAEASISTLVGYKTTLQTDDSIELGLRIIAHLHQDSSHLTINPSTVIWNILSRPKTRSIARSTGNLKAVSADLRRKICPYISVNIGLTKGFSTILLNSRHWYVLLVLAADKLLGYVIKVISAVCGQVNPEESLSEEVGEKKLLMLYKKTISERTMSKPDGIALVISDSLGLPLLEAGWDQVESFLFTCLQQSLTTSIRTVGNDLEFGTITSLSTESQEMHIACASIAAVQQIIWPNRIHVPGPEQPNCISCGAYALTTVWKLAEYDGFDAMNKLVQSSFAMGREVIDTLHHSGKERVLRSTFKEMYDDAYVETVIRKFDRFVRSEVIKKS